jgi:DNA-binding NtrC family response regulator
MKTEKILIVDDEAELADLLKLNLGRTGRYEVRVENSGEGAVVAVKEFKPALVLLDIRMSGMDGMETLRQIKQIDENVQVVMTTAVEEDWVGRLAMKLGAFEYITKPFELARLDTVISVALSMKKG